MGNKIICSKCSQKYKPIKEFKEYNNVIPNILYFITYKYTYTVKNKRICYSCIKLNKYIICIKCKRYGKCTKYNITNTNSNDSYDITFCYECALKHYIMYKDN